MRVSQLSAESGMSVATIKYYLRERLLHEGQLTSATQAQYDESHLARLHLVRALLGPGGLSVAATRNVLTHLEHPPASVHDLLGVAQSAVTPPADPDLDLGRARQLIAQWGWHVDHEDCDTQAMLARALDALDHAGFELPDGALNLYADAMRRVAEAEIDALPIGSQAEAVRYVVLGTVLIEPLLLAIRRLAEQDASARRFGVSRT